MKRAMDSFMKHVKYTGIIQWILHEDVVLKKESGQILTWAKYNSIFDQIIKTEPAQRLTHAVKMLLDVSKSKYLLKLEDDWIFVRDVDIDYIIDTMDNNPDMNQIYFSKARQSTKVILKNGYKVIAPVGKGPYEFAMAPGVWRTSFIKPRWNENTNAYCPIMDRPVGDYLYGNDEGKQNIEHIGTISTSQVKVE
jgi:hypothetical protein